LPEFKFYCFHGRFEYVDIIFGVHTTNPTRSFYNRNWEKQNFTTRRILETEPFPKPDRFEEMIAIAEKLAQKFVFVRVDLYNVNTKIYFSELTFSPASGMVTFIPQE